MLTKKATLDAEFAPREFDTAPITKAVSDLVGRPLPPGKWYSMLFDVDVNIEIDEFTLSVALHPPVRIESFWANCHKCGKSTDTGFRPKTTDDFDKVISALRSRPQSSFLAKIGRRIVGNCRH